METNVEKLQDMLKLAYRKLSKCEDTFAGGNGWKSDEQQRLMNEIADALDIAEKGSIVIAC